MSKEVSPWLLNGKTVVIPEFIPEGVVGFCYIIVKKDRPTWAGYTDVIYVGKKLLNSTTKQKLSKKAQQALIDAKGGDKRVAKTKKVVKASWENYLTSSPEVKALLQEYPERYERWIVDWAYSKKHLTYLEIKWMIMMKSMEMPSYNLNMMGTIFKRDIPGTDEYKADQALKQAKKK